MDPEVSARHLNSIAQHIRDGQAVEPISVRELIGWFAALRRGANVNWAVRRALEQAGLVTEPDFEGSHIDGRVHLTLANAAQPEQQADNAPGEPAIVAPAAPEPAPALEFIGGAVAEPAYRVSRLLDPNLQLISIGPDATLQEAATLMARHDYSQLPVMNNVRDVRGVISWDNIGPAMILTNPEAQLVRECMKPQVEVKTTDSIFQVINRIIESSYVLVRDGQRAVVGILTTTDLSQQFQDLAEPFLLIGEIESHIRALIDGRFTHAELAAARNANDPDRRIDSVADLTLGEHTRLLQNPDNWRRLGLRADRGVFGKELDEIRQLRNDVMHFDSDRITDLERKSLRNFVQFLHQLKAHQVPVVPAREAAATQRGSPSPVLNCPVTGDTP